MTKKTPVSLQQGVKKVETWCTASQFKKVETCSSASLQGCFVYKIKLDYPQ